jgi:multiple sugar transport system ATP-binding protein
MAGITYKNVTKRWGEVVGVQDLSFEVADKEFVVFVGPSGCGKSTTLRLLAGLEEITEGEVYIGDRLVNDVPPKDRDIAMVFQSYALYPHMNVYDNMAFGLRLRKTPKQEIDRRVHEAADILGIGNLLDRKPKQLSGGQRQRVAIGRAIVREPNVFLMDEPLSNLDAKLRVQARAELTKLHHRLETTFVYVTHDQVEAMTMGTRILVLKDGLMMQIDTPQNLYDRPDNLFVAGFIGSPSMNFFDAELVHQDGKVMVDTRDFMLQIPEDRTGVYRDHVGKEVIFGIRPDNTYDRGFAPPGIKEAVVEARVDVTELLGNEVVVYLATDHHEFLGRFDPRIEARVGNMISIAFDMDRMHVFDKQTEQAIR